MDEVQIRVFSDVSFQLFTRELAGRVGVIEENYGPIALALHGLDHLDEKSTPILIHSDPIFLRHSIPEQKEILEITLEVSQRFPQLHIYLSNLSFVPPPWEPTKTIGQQHCQELFELQLTLAEQDNINFLDARLCLTELGQIASYHYQLGHAYQMPYQREFVQRYCQEIHAKITWSESAQQKKVVVLDADHTLWGGILGEDGYRNLSISRDSHGAAYYDFQKFLVGLKAKGFLLALCTKNNRQDILEAFDAVSMPLQLSDFSAIRANWRPKSENIGEISRELNLGLDSFIFLDDSEFEIEEVSTQWPSVTCLLFKNEYSDFLGLTQHPAFLMKALTNEDKNRARFYRDEETRKALRGKLSHEDYLKRLKIEIQIGHNQDGDIDRLAQLTERTNQFNFHKHELSTQELMSFKETGNHIFSIRVQDKFGDYGIAGLVLLEAAGRVKNFLLSCRVLGRGVEEHSARAVVAWCQANDLPITEVSFQESLRNQPALQFLERAQELFLNSKNSDL